MKALVCEMCNSNDLVKQDGCFVCQCCGTKYSVEEAKKMMIEGTVDVSGSTVKVDNSDRIEKLYEMARRENEKLDGNALKYYEEIAIERPNDWEANFYVDYYNVSKATLGEAFIKLLSMLKTIENTFKLVKEYEKTENHKAIYTEIKDKCNSIAYLWRATAESTYKPLGQTGAEEYINIASMSFSVRNSLADFLIQYFEDTEMAVEIYKSIIEDIRSAWLEHVFSDTAKEVIEKIKKYDSSYQAPQIKTGGCYVATAVYGSYDCPQVWTLRRFRDYTLAETWYGRAFIHTYYAISPTIVKWFGKTEWFKKMWRGKLDKMVYKLNENGVENTPYEDKKW